MYLAGRMSPHKVDKVNRLLLLMLACIVPRHAAHTSQCLTVGQALEKVLDVYKKQVPSG